MLKDRPVSSCAEQILPNMLAGGFRFFIGVRKTYPVIKEFYNSETARAPMAYENAKDFGEKIRQVFQTEGTDRILSVQPWK